MTQSQSSNTCWRVVHWPSTLPVNLLKMSPWCFPTKPPDWNLLLRRYLEYEETLGICSFLPAKRKVLLISLMDRHQEKSVCKIVATYQVTGDVLIAQVGRKGHICYSSCRWSHWFSFWQSGALAHDLQSSAQRGELKGDGGGNHHPCTFQVLTRGINCWNPSRNEILVILMHYFPWYSYSNGFSSVFQP